ncbi:MAG: winged helix-turn-helix transcriptional regulator [Elusimicrobia bacterium]|nr:winged helix-turn-helix transcriptional regulator [Elusimicrobiota bacterium]
MKENIIKKHKKESEIFKALGHPTRLFIVHQLGKENTCVCDLTEMIGDDISTVSKHLSVLKAAKIVESVKIGNKIVYKLKLKCVLSIALCIKRDKGE